MTIKVERIATFFAAKRYSAIKRNVGFEAIAARLAFEVIDAINRDDLLGESRSRNRAKNNRENRQKNYRDNFPNFIHLQTCLLLFYHKQHDKNYILLYVCVLTIIKICKKVLAMRFCLCYK